MSANDSLDRRDFLKTVGATGLALEAAASAFAAKSTSPVRWPRDRRQRSHQCRSDRRMGAAASTSRTSSIWSGRRATAARSLRSATYTRSASGRRRERYSRCKGYLDYRDVLRQPGCGCRDRRHAGPLARARSRSTPWITVKMCTWKSPWCTPTRRPATGQHREGDQARTAGRIADHFGRHLVESEESHRRRHDRADAHEPGLVPSQLYRRRVELAHRQAEAGPDGKGDDYIDWNMWLGRNQARPSGPTTPTASSASASIGTTRGGIATDLFYHVVAPLQHLLGRAAVSREGDGDGRNLRFQRRARSARHVPPDGRILQGPFAGAEFVDGELAAHPRPDSRSRRHHHHGGARQFESMVPYITVKPAMGHKPGVQGATPIGGREVRRKIRHQRHPDSDGSDEPAWRRHVKNFLECVHTRAETAPGRRDRRPCGGGDQSGGAVLP